ncbi:MAG: long-chain-fatty-acid--CoA ligase [Nitrospirales bacterium]|nr:MAG: long-chain-fatty-acid--CoA ligase [Nitrospirales bacterium]
MTSLPMVWREAEGLWPEKIALITDRQELTYRELAAHIRRLSNALVCQWNVRPGDVVALLAPNSAEFVLSYFAVTAIAGIVHPVDERLKPEEIRFLLEDSGARFAIVHQALWSKFSTVWKTLPAVEQVLAIGDVEATSNVDCFDTWVNRPADPGDLANMDMTPATDAIAEFMYTSGTIGKPKGAMRSHANARAASGNARRAFGYRHEDVIAIVMPLSHSSALVSQMLPMVEVGGTAVLVERFDAVDLLARIRDQTVTCFRAVPATFKMLMVYPEFDADHLPSLRLLMNSSAAIESQTHLDIKARFPEVELVNSYGLTEASTCTILSDAIAREHPDSIGVPIPGVEMAIMDDEECPVEEGLTGEIWVRGPHVCHGYHHLPAETDALFAPGGWLRTGDMGHKDAQGLFYFHGRKVDVINCGGRKYAPVEVERCILEFKDVAEVAVLGVPHRVLGQVAKAYVVFRDRATGDLKAVTRHCARSLPSHKVPFFIESVEALPRNSLGKMLHRELKRESQAVLRSH